MDQKDPGSNMCQNKLVEFMHDLQKALQNGQIKDETSKSQSFASQANIDNLPNQTFMYIVNWLKSHQLKLDEKSSIASQDNQDNQETGQMFDYIDEVKYLRNKLKQQEVETESLTKRVNELQEENAALRNQNGQSGELDNLRKLVSELTRQNEEKDRKVDELSKQVLRFKRIQEIVLSAQSANNSNMSSSILAYSKNQKNYDEIDIETLNENVARSEPDKEESKERGQILPESSGKSNKNSNDQIINSGSLSSSISSTSSSTNSITAQGPAQNMAPLATISELTNYSTSSTSTLLTTPKPDEKEQKPNNSQKSPKYSSAITLSSPNKSFSPSPKSSNNQNKSLRQFFGKLMRTSLVNINDSNNFTLNKNTNFKRGGFRSTASARLQSNPNLDTLTFSKWNTSQVCQFLHKNGFDAYFSPDSNDSTNFSHRWIKNGLHLLQATQYDYEKELGIKNALHRKKLSLFLQSIINSSHLGPESKNLCHLDQYWVLKWLDDIGLPQYKDVFGENLFDGRMLMHINNEDFQYLNINSELHFLSIKRAIHVLRLNNFDPQCLRRRPSGDDLLDKSEVMLWTNHRVMEWLRSIDLSEYAPNLRGSGVHGGLMVFEARFNSTLLADILSIPASKTLLRRHLTTLFNDLIGAQMLELKKKAESQAGYQQLTAFSKVKHVKKVALPMASLFSSTHKRTKSQDSRDFLSITPILDLNIEQKKDKFNFQSATLPSNASNYSEDVATFKSKLVGLANFKSKEKI